MKDDLRRQHPLTQRLVGFKVQMVQALDDERKGHLKRKRWAISLTLPSIFLNTRNTARCHACEAQNRPMQQSVVLYFTSISYWSS